MIISIGNYRDDPELMNVLESGSVPDLRVLIDLITNNNEGRISLSTEAQKKLHESTAPINERYLIAEEIQQFGANTIVSLFRGGKGVLYKEIVADVASHVGANFSDKQDVAMIESAILLKIIEKAIEKMTEEEKKILFDQFGVRYEGVGPTAMAALIAAIRLSGFAPYKLAAIVAQSIAKSILGRGLSFAATAPIMRGISTFAGPVGWAVTGIWTVFDLASPAYRLTVPCVIQIAYMRQKAMNNECPTCQEPVAKGAKFCGECGQKLT